MSFSPDYRTLRNGRPYRRNLRLEMSLNTENTADAPEVHDSVRADEQITGVSPDLIGKIIDVNFEPLKAQISTLT